METAQFFRTYELGGELNIGLERYGYLGGSTHVCWRELGEPVLDSVLVSRFSAVPATNLRILNFGHRLPLLAALVAIQPNRFNSNTSVMAIVLASVTCWPLVASCSIRVPDRSIEARPEYLISQLVLEWIMRTNSFHGVRYFSTHYVEYPDNPKTYMNYAFPARTSAAAGYCSELTQLFELTEPKQWYSAKALPPAIAARPIYKRREQILIDLEDEWFLFQKMPSRRKVKKKFNVGKKHQIRVDLPFTYDHYDCSVGLFII